MESRRVGRSDHFFSCLIIHQDIFSPSEVQITCVLESTLMVSFFITLLKIGCSRISHPALWPLSQRKVSHKLQFFFNHSSIFLQYTYVLLFVSVIRGSSFGLQIGNQGWSWLGYRTKETRSWDHTGMDRSVSSGHGIIILLILLIFFLSFFVSWVGL